MNYLKNQLFTVIWFSFINIFFTTNLNCNRVENQSFSTNNVNSLTILGGIVTIGVIGFIGYKIYKWYNPTVPPVSGSPKNNGSPKNFLLDNNQSSSSESIEPIEPIISRSSSEITINSINDGNISELPNFSDSQYFISEVDQIDFYLFDYTNLISVLTQRNEFSEFVSRLNFNVSSDNDLTLAHLFLMNFKKTLNCLNNKILINNHNYSVAEYQDMQNVLINFLSYNESMKNQYKLAVDVSQANSVDNYFNNVEMDAYVIIDALSVIIQN